MAVAEKWKNTLPLMFSTSEAAERVLNAIKPDQRIMALYLFGSRASNKETSESDIDLAFFTSGDFSWDDYYLLHGSVAKCLKTDRFNLLWLNKADSIITFDVIATGKLLFYRDADKLNDFELKAKKNFYDYKLYLKRHMNNDP